MIKGMEVFEQVAQLDEAMIDQFFGDWKPDAPCCVGAHLAYFITADKTFYLDGIDAWAKKMGGNRAHVIILLRHAGAGQNPLGSDDWENTPQSVWENLQRIEKLPDLIGAKLLGADLIGANLTGANLTGADLTLAKLLGADLTGADLTGADLTGADLTLAKLLGADLTGADLTGADLARATLEDADLTCATLEDANLIGADLTRAKLD